jgi:mono/diheme cytochrome c family protein
MNFASTTGKLGLKWVLWVAALVVLVLVIAACAPVQPGAAPAPAAAEATTAPAEATTAPAEAVATEAPAEAAAEATEPPAEAPAEVAMAGDAANGQYIATVTGGCGCHFNADLGGLAGGRKFEGPFGVVYAKNLTPDEETGIAGDSDQILVDILRTGVEDPGDGSPVEIFHPIMPYKTFSVLSDKDAFDIVAYLRSLEPINNPVPERELTEEPAPWTPATTPPAESPTEPVARGEYLVTLANCGSCHTPKNADGSPMPDMFLAGGPVGEEFSANITPDEATGLGAWSAEDIAKYLLTGTEPDGKQAEGAMAQQIERRFSKLTKGDAAAIGDYLKTIPAVSNDPSPQ